MSPRIDLKLKLSPLTSVKESASKKTRRQERVTQIDELKAGDFVAVASPNVKKRVFTKHQIEKMKEKASDIPALYNDMSQSVSQMDFEVFSQDSVNSQNVSSAFDQRKSCFANSFEGKIKDGQPTTRSDPEVSESKFYSDEELNAVLRDTSNELEKSLSDSVIILDSSKEEEYKQINSSHKRKSQTPSRKTLCDIKKKLKGVNRNLNSGEEKQVCTIDSLNKDLSPLATPLKSPQRNRNRRSRRAIPSETIPSKVADKDTEKIQCVPQFQKENGIKNSSFSESEDEIPNSQSDTVNPSNDRPKRKRKSIFEDNTIYVTPSKRTKLMHPAKTSEKPEQNSSLAIIDACNNITVEQIAVQSPCIESDSNHSKDVTENSQSLINGFSESEKDKPCSASYTSPSSSPCKITRSGRRIVAPNKDMPEPMTPPGLKSKKLSTKDKEGEVKEKVTSSELLGISSSSSSSSPVKNVEMNITKNDQLDNPDQSSDKKNEIINSNDEFSKEKLSFSDSSSITPSKLSLSKRKDVRNGKGTDSPHKENSNKLPNPSETRLPINSGSEEKERSEIRLASPIKDQTPTKRKICLSVEEMETCEKDEMQSEKKNLECAEKSSSNITSIAQENVKVPEGNCKKHEEGKTLDTSSAASSDIKSLDNSREKSDILGKSDSRILPSKLERTTKRNSDLCSEIHIANGGIVFTKAPHKDLIQTGNLNRASGYSLRKCKSLEKFSPTKMASSHISIFKIARDNAKKSNEKESSSPSKIHSLPRDIPITSLSDPDNMVNDKEKKESNSKLEEQPKETVVSPLISKLQLHVIPKGLKGPDTIPILVTPENKRIIIISSPRSSTAPVNKAVYSSQPGKQFLKLENNQIYIRSKTKCNNNINNNNNNKGNESNNNNNNNNNNNLKDADSSIKDLKQTDIKKANEKPQPIEIHKELKPNEEVLSETSTKLPSDDEQDLPVLEMRRVTPLRNLKRTVKRKSKFSEQDSGNDDQSNNSDHREEFCIGKQKDKGSTEKDDEICISEKDSPAKSSSKLSNSIGTPERKKGSVRKSQRTGTRAAMLLACAKKNMKNRDENLDVSMEEIVSETCPDDKMMVDDENESSHMSPNITPSYKGSISATFMDEKSWMKHYSSPKASPCGSILKKRHTEEVSTSNCTGDVSESAESSPSISKGRRVSFADPPVSERIEIPALQPGKSHKAQKRLDMSQALEPGMSQNSEDNSEFPEDNSGFPSNTPNCSQPLYSSLLGCPDSIELILPKLTTASLAESLKVVFRDRGIKTVGDLCALSEMELQSFPVRAPKTELTVKALKEFEDQYKEKSSKVILPFGTSTESEVLQSEEVDVLSNDVEETATPTSSKPPSDDKDDPVSTSDHKESSFSQSSSENRLQMAKPENEEINNQTQIEDDGELRKKFSAFLSREDEAISDLIESLTMEARQKLFESLTKVIPYRDVVDMFHQYLSRQNVL